MMLACLCTNCLWSWDTGAAASLLANFQQQCASFILLQIQEDEETCLAIYFTIYVHTYVCHQFWLLVKEHKDNMKSQCKTILRHTELIFPV